MKKRSSLPELSYIPFALGEIWILMGWKYQLTLLVFSLAYHSDPRPFHSPEKARGYQRIVFLHYNMLCCRMAGLWNLLQQSKQRVVLFQTRGPREWFNSLVFKWIMASPQPGIPGKVFSICIPIGALEEQDKALWHGLEFSVPLFLFSVWVHEWHRCYLARLFVVPSDFGSQLIQPMKPSCGSIPQR